MLVHAASYQLPVYLLPPLPKQIRRTGTASSDRLYEEDYVGRYTLANQDKFCH